MKTNKIITTILVFVAIFMLSIFVNSVEATSLGYVTITKDRQLNRN